MKPNVKDLGVIVLIGLLLLWGFLAAIERLIFFHTNQYPDFLVNKTISLDSKEKMFEMIKSTCPQGGSDSIERADALYFRCGLFWPTSKVTKIFIKKPSPEKTLGNN